MFFLPSLFHPRESGWGRPEFLTWILNAMCVSKAWYDTVMCTHELWGGILPSLSYAPHWQLACERAGEAPRRLLYGDVATWARNDAQVTRAVSIHAEGSCSSWRDFGELLQGLRLPHAKVLRLRPSEHNKPDLLPEARRSLTTAPSLIDCEISSPIAFDAENLRRLVVSNFWVDQLRHALSKLKSLRHLEIHRTRSVGKIDWTALISQTNCASLETLIFWCSADQSAQLQPGVNPIPAPCLRKVDAGGAILLQSPHVRSMHLENVAWQDLAAVLSASSAASLTVRSLIDGEPQAEGVDDLILPVNLPLLDAAIEVTLIVMKVCGNSCTLQV
ncbi:unnamed protein product [Peniophora sp. CBMAI 1063]|nr:unnamed protein product [Peniophora sp. CBMAI 1063]